MFIRRILTFSSLFAATFLQAQDLTGVWQGHFRAGNTSARSSANDDRYKFEVQIAQHSKLFEAVTYSYLSTLFYGKAAANGTLNPKTHKVILQEVKLLDVRNQTGGVCIMTCFLQYTRSGDDEFLEGTYSSMDVKDSTNCGRGTVFLHKTLSSDFYKEPFLARREKEIEEEKLHKAPPAVKVPPPVTTRPKTTDSSANRIASRTPVHHPRPAAPPASQPSATPPRTAARPLSPSLARTSGDTGSIARNFSTVTPGVLLHRSNVLTRAIVVNTNEVTLNIYDDGAIDNDTISVFLDKKQVISHAMLTDQPIVLTIHLDESNDFHELVMVAENEGEIPPNTSLMIVKAGDKRYEVRIISTEQKNAVVTFKYEKPK